MKNIEKITEAFGINASTDILKLTQQMAGFVHSKVEDIAKANELLDCVKELFDLYKK